jgi:hypothetical protein
MDQPNLAGPVTLILYPDPAPPLTWVGAALVENVVDLFLV